jgi:hypothetical protein
MLANWEVHRSGRLGSIKSLADEMWRSALEYQQEAEPRKFSNERRRAA